MGEECVLNNLTAHLEVEKEGWVQLEDVPFTPLIDVIIVVKVVIMLMTVTCIIVESKGKSSYTLKH